MISGSNINKEDIVNHQRFLKGYLTGKVPEADLTEGSFINDVVIKSMAYILALFDEESKNIKSRLSINTLQEVEDLTAVQVLDNIASNFFISRKEGKFSTGILRVYLSTNEKSVVITPQTRFTKAAGVHFMYAGGIDGETSLTVTSSDLVEVTDSLGESLGEWYLEVPVIGESVFLGSELAPGSFQSVNPSIENLIRIENIIPFTPADELETNKAFADRISSALTNRGLSSSSGIKTHLLDTVPNINKIEVVGSSSSLLRRDLLESGGTLTNFKTLGKCNIYSSLGLTTINKSLNFLVGSFPAAQNGLITLEVASTDISRLAVVQVESPFIRIDKIIDSSGNSIVTLRDNKLVTDAGLDYVEPDKHLEFSYLDITDASVPNIRGEFFSRTAKERLALKVNDSTSDITISLKCKVGLGTGLVENELESDNNRIPGLDTLNYLFNIKNLYLTIKYFRNPLSDTVPVEVLKTDLSSFINTHGESNSNITLAEIYSYILSEYSAYVSGIDFSDSSGEMSIFLPNGRTVFFETGSTTSLVSASTREYYEIVGDPTIRVHSYLPENYLTLLQVGDPTCQVYSMPENITFIEVQV